VKGKGALTVAAIVCVSTLQAPAARAGESARTTLTITGMNCGGCAAGVKIQLKRMEGVTRYDVSYEKGEAQVSYDPAKTTPEKIAESVAAKTGYKVAVKGSKKTTSAGQGSIAPLPAPIFWRHQLQAEGADQKLCLDPARLRRQAIAPLEKRG
jgi:copper chaperone CopZ